MKIFYRAKERGKEGRLVDLSLENGDRLHSTNLFLFSLSLSVSIFQRKYVQLRGINGRS